MVCSCPVGSFLVSLVALLLAADIHLIATPFMQAAWQLPRASVVSFPSLPKRLRHIFSIFTVLHWDVVGSWEALPYSISECNAIRPSGPDTLGASKADEIKNGHQISVVM
jgi:hypothetical protein